MERWMGKRGPDELSYAVVLPSLYGDIIVNRYDVNQTNALLKTGVAWDSAEIRFFSGLASKFQPGMAFLDVGSNFGLYAIAIAKACGKNGGVVHAFEAQRMLSYMISGSAALGGLENLHVHWTAVGRESGQIDIPGFDYRIVSNFGSIEFGENQNEFIGQPRQASSEKVKLVTLDSCGFQSVGAMKIDVEGMEMDVLAGAENTISRDMPVLLVEHLKGDKGVLRGRLQAFGYEVKLWGANYLCYTPEHLITYAIRFG